MNVIYHKDSNLSTAEFIDVLIRSTLAERRPIQDVDRIEKMLDCVRSQVSYLPAT